jgi:hypothetical protein
MEIGSLNVGLLPSYKIGPHMHCVQFPMGPYMFLDHFPKMGPCGFSGLYWDICRQAFSCLTDIHLLHYVHIDNSGGYLCGDSPLVDECLKNERASHGARSTVDDNGVAGPSRGSQTVGLPRRAASIVPTWEMKKPQKDFSAKLGVPSIWRVITCRIYNCLVPGPPASIQLVRIMAAMQDPTGVFFTMFCPIWMRANRL